MLKQYFIKHAIKEMEIERFIKDNFPMGDYSKIEIQRTPLGMKILIHTNKPGRIIGRSGRNINEMTDAIKQRFGLENPQLDVKTIRNPDFDAKIVAKQIASSLERGFNHKKIGNLSIKRIMDAGAVGAEIRTKMQGKEEEQKGQDIVKELEKAETEIPAAVETPKEGKPEEVPPEDASGKKSAPRSKQPKPKAERKKVKKEESKEE